MRTDGPVARLAHPLYGEVRRAAMGTLRARRLRGRVAQTLDVVPDPIPRAVLTLDSDLPPEPALFLQAAEAATRMYDLPLAERLARAAAATGDPPPGWCTPEPCPGSAAARRPRRSSPTSSKTAADDGTLALAQLYRAGNLSGRWNGSTRPAEALTAAENTGAPPQLVTAMTLSLAASVGELAPVLARGPGLMREDLPDDLTRIVVASAVSAAAAVTGKAELLDEAAVVGGLTGDRVPTSHSRVRARWPPGARAPPCRDTGSGSRAGPLDA